MGRTIPSFRIAAMMEQSKWRSFRYNLDKNDRKIFDELFSISRLYNSACSNCARPMVIQCILMSDYTITKNKKQKVSNQTR